MEWPPSGVFLVLPDGSWQNGVVSDSKPSVSIPRGAVDLGALAAQREAEQAAASAPPGLVKDVTTASFEADVIQQSMTVPVVIDLWATWCGPCKTLSPVLESLAAEYGGRFVLAKVDVDAEQQIGAAFQVQSIPSVFGVIKGQPVPLFQGALPKDQVKQVIDALLAEAAKNGVDGRVGGAEAPEPDEEPGIASDPDIDAAYDAMEAGDWDAAESAFNKVLARDPGDAGAKIGVATAKTYRRVGDLDPLVVLDAADKDDSAEVQIQAADWQAINGDYEAAFARLIDVIRRTQGDDRAAVRDRLLELFEVCGPEHPDVAKARVSLANALF